MNEKCVRIHAITVFDIEEPEEMSLGLLHQHEWFADFFTFLSDTSYFVFRSCHCFDCQITLLVSVVIIANDVF
jgi:hypothetical protein